MLVALVLALAAAPAPTMVSGPGLRIDWQAPAGCPDAAALRERVVAMVGEAATRGADLSARAVVRVEGGRYRLALELTRAGGSERRALSDGACEALAQAAALVVAVAIDPQARAPEPVPEDRSMLPGEDPPAVVPAPPVEPVEPPVEPGTGPVAAVPKDRPSAPPIEPTGDAPRRPGPAAAVPKDRSGEAPPRGEASGSRPLPSPRLALGLRLGVGLGFARVLPGPHAALDLGLGLDGRGWRVELGGLFVPPVRGTAAGNPEIGGVFRLGAAEARGCYMPQARGGRLAIPVCLGMQVGAMHGRGRGSGLAETTTARSLWLALRPGVAVRLRPGGGRVGLWFGVDMLVALIRPAFITAGGVLVHEAARVGGQASLGVEVRLR